MTTPEELFDRCQEIVTADGGGEAVNRMMHETLVLACMEGTRTAGMGFGNVFAQVDYLCKTHGVSQRDRHEIQTMRRHSNRRETLAHGELLYDVRALCVFISAVFSMAIPSRLTAIIPRTGRPLATERKVNARCVRCIVDSWDESHICVTADAEGTDMGAMRVDYGDPEQGTDMSYLKRLLREGMQLNLLDCHVEGDLISPQFVVVEPDFLIDISSLAACFTDYGHHPLAYTISRMRPRANSQPILLGNFAGSALDAIINNPRFNLNETITNSFREQALMFCTCPGFNPDTFLEDARRQADNLKEVADVLSTGGTFDLGKVIIEPSFVCERLGLQGRADMMTTDFRLLVEQKSGKNPYISASGSHTPTSYIESHYVQLLLYYGVLRYNFGFSDRHVDMRLLYSRYPARQGLLAVNFYRGLFHEAIRLRNRIVACEYHIARHGFGTIMGRLSADTLNERGHEDRFFATYIRPQTEAVTAPLHCLEPLDRAYFERMMTFVYREQMVSKVGAREGVTGSVADLWNMPLAEKFETGCIIAPLVPCNERLRPSTGVTESNYEAGRVSFRRVRTACEDGNGIGQPLSFRRGDMIYLYKYDDEPDVRRSLLHKGTIETIDDDGLTIRLHNAQRNTAIFSNGTFAVEHAASDIGTTSAIRGLHTFITAPEDRRGLLLGRREPQTDTTVGLTRQYNPNYDGILLQAMQARDYFLLVGPPGTGKTSMALRFMVEEELRRDAGNTILLMSYTNRAVDEICSMLCDADISFLRMGGETSCDPRFRDRLLDMALGERPRLDEIRRRIAGARVIVSTTSTLQSRPFIFELKRFTLAVVDEASQILEPDIVGLLSAHRDGRCCIDRFIMIGDHKQLPAVVQQREQDSLVDDPQLNAIGLTDCRNSLFERLITTERRSGRDAFTGILRKQGRMHPDIARFPNAMFYARERLEPVPCPHQTETELHYDLPSEDATDDLLKSRRMIFIPSEPCRNPALSDKVNVSEARIVADIARRIYRFCAPQFDPDRTLGVIVPYRNQIAMIRSEISRLGIEPLNRISIDTVERYQGSQRDVIVYSFTVQTRSQLTFLTSCCFTEDGKTIDRKLNVAMTRARRQMIMTGNVKTLRHNEVFRQLIDYTTKGDNASIIYERDNKTGQP